MSQDGKAILRSLQNDSMPWIDLVIRESFQNSLDATKSEESSTIINVFTNEFKTKEVAHHFDKIQNVLIERFKDSQTVLVIQDKNTTGLDGVTHSVNNDKAIHESNFYKLVYGLSMNQNGEDKGGSWGLGKTSFFRIGVGIVAYYTRVKLPNGQFEERLAASLIEDPNGTNPLINSELGLVWWGEKNSTSARPLVDSELIQKFLEDFGIPKYNNDETGTTVIIPFIKNYLFDRKMEEEKKIFWWETSIESSIQLAIQRWYGSRILNDKYTEIIGNSKLETSVNGKMLMPREFEPLFTWLYNLYNSAISRKPENDKIEVKKISNLRNVLANPSEAVGYIAYVRLDAKEISMVGQNSGYSPFSYVNFENFEENSKKGHALLAYSRKPGMVVEYVMEDSPWFKNVPILDETFILAYFVPNSGALLNESYHKNYQKPYTTLESYVRDTENADHARWIDKIDGQSKITIISRIQKYVSDAIGKSYINEIENRVETQTSVLQRKLGQIYLPPHNFGKSAKAEGELKSLRPIYNGKQRISNINIELVSPLNHNTVRVAFSAYFHQKGKSDLRFDVSSIDKNIDEVTWKKDMNNLPYPFEIKEVELTQLNGVSINLVEEAVQNIQLEVQPDNNKGTIRIESKFDEGMTLNGYVDLSIYDETMQPELVIRSVK